MNHVLRAAEFMAEVRAGKHPNAHWLVRRFGMALPTAQRFVRSVRDDLGAPIFYSDADRGWELRDKDWRFVL
jgi:hypothetical protein